MTTKNKKQQHHLGVDIGRVIMAPVRDGQPDTSFLTGTMEQAMQTPPTEGAMEHIARLVDVSTATFGSCRRQVHPYRRRPADGSVNGAFSKKRGSRTRTCAFV